MDKTPSELELPGFRFHPTEEELLGFYLRKVVLGEKLNFDIIGTLNLYRYDPSELPGLAKIGEREWYFFVPRDRKHANGGRPNRTTEHGFWKATGSDRHIRSVSDPKRIIGLKKTLVFYRGRAPRGCKTDWVMNEYRMPDSFQLPKEDIVLCKIYRKATSFKVLEQRAAMGEEKRIPQDYVYPANTASSSEPDNCRTPIHDFDDKTGIVQKSEGLSLQVGPMKENLTELQVPKFGSEWVQDPFLTPLRSPWLENWGHYANVLNF